MRAISMRRARSGAVAAVAVAALAGGATLAANASAATQSPHATQAQHGSLGITRQFFGATTEPYTGQPADTYRYHLTNARGMSADVLSYGGIIQQINVPGRSGDTKNVVLGFKTLSDYVKFDSPPVTANGGPYFGQTIGRFGNRIAKGTFQLNGQTYTLPINNGVNALHGGLNGFGNHVWSQKALINNGSQVGVTLELVSPNGDESHPAGSPGCPDGCTGYPAQLTVDVTFTLDNSNNLRIKYSARNDDPKLATVVNLTNHSYFNLAGEDSAAGSAYGQLVRMNADTYSPTDTTQIPLGYNVSVRGTPFDFTKPQAIGARIGDVTAPDNAPAADPQLSIAQGYDHNWVLNRQTSKTTGPDGLNLAATAQDPASGRLLTVWTDQPGVQFYSGNFLTGSLTGISGHAYRQGAGYTFETQHFPNSPNQPNFPTTTLNAGQTLNSTTIFAFSS